MFFFCSYHVNTPMSNILYDRTKRDKPFGKYTPILAWREVRQCERETFV